MDARETIARLTPAQAACVREAREDQHALYGAQFRINPRHPGARGLITLGLVRDAKFTASRPGTRNGLTSLGRAVRAMLAAAAKERSDG